MTAIAARGSVPRSSSLLANTAVLSATMLAVSAGNYGLNVALARLLDPADFGDANLAINLVLAAAVVAATLQLVASKAVASDPDRREAVRHTLVRMAWAAGGVALAVLGGGAWLLADALRTSTPWMFVVLGLGLPVYFVQAVHRGTLQGDLRIGRLALSYGIEGTVRVAGALALVWAGFGVIGASIGIALSFVASGLVARGDRAAKAEAGGGVPWASLRPTVLGATVLLVGQVVINNGDLFLSKAFFDPATAGVYASAALIGRAVFFFSWSIVHAVFPVAARADANAAEQRRAIRGALVLVSAIGFTGLATVAVAGDLVASVLFGDGYTGAAGILAPYVAATSLFAVANLLAAVDVARGRLGAPLALVGGAVLQSALLAVAGDTPQSMVWLQVVAMALTVVAVGVAGRMGDRKWVDRAL
jgi:O-antigen/teichoic acid export membrane protein